MTGGETSVAKSVERSGLKSEEAYDYIRQKIETGHFPGGSKLTLNTLSAEIGVSLTPIREALRMLQAKRPRGIRATPRPRRHPIFD